MSLLNTLLREATILISHKELCVFMLHNKDIMRPQSYKPLSTDILQSAKHATVTSAFLE